MPSESEVLIDQMLGQAFERASEDSHEWLLAQVESIRDHMNTETDNGLVIVADTFEKKWILFAAISVFGLSLCDYGKEMKGD